MKKLILPIFLSLSALIFYSMPTKAISIKDPNYPNCVFNTVGGKTTNVSFDGFIKSFDNSSIKKFVIPEKVEGYYTVTQIGYSAFNDCNNLEELVIPSTVNKINLSLDEYSSDTFTPFTGCNALRAIYVYAEQPPTHTLTDIYSDTYDAFSELDHNKVSIYVPSSTVSAYKSSWNYFTNILPATEEIQFDAALNFRTYYSNHHLVKNGDLEAFTVSSIDEAQKELVLTPIDDNVIPAGTGVILKGQKGTTYTLDMAYSAPTLQSSNLLKGTETDTVFTDYSTNNPIYILVNKENQPAFYPMTTTSSDNNYSLKAHKAFIPGSESKSNKYKISDHITGIRNLEKTTDFNHKIYDLNGRICPAQKGIFILNRKKYFMK